MRLSLSTSGGLAAAVRLDRPPTVVDTSTLPGPEAGELAALVQAARDERPPPRPARPVPDETSYRITVDEPDAPAVLERTDTTMSPAFADLLDWLQRHGSPGSL